MKKFLPAIFVVVFFAVVLVAQMSLNGQKSSASRVELSKEKHIFYQGLYSKAKFSTIDNKTYNLKDQEKSIVIINFWASWCKPCLAEFKTLNQFVKKYGDKVLVLGINNDDVDADKLIKKTKDKYELSFDIVKDEKGIIASTYDINTVPFTIVFHKGKVLSIYNRENNFMSSEFTDLIESKL